MRNIKLIITYDGSPYLGWQKTSIGPSIEATLQQVIEQVMQHPAPLQAASRTDAGVHAEGQVVNFLTAKAHLDLNKFHMSLNRLLPKDIVVLSVEEMPISFHPTIDCTGKEYRYFISTGPIQLPHDRFTSWHVPNRLDLDLIREALPFLIGAHDFAAFCNAKKSTHYTDYVREIQRLELIELEKKRLSFQIVGNHFLYKMVRNIVGTLVEIGRRKLELDALPMILQLGYRSKAGVTAPAHGLSLYQIFYQH